MGYIDHSLSSSVLLMQLSSGVLLFFWSIFLLPLLQLATQTNLKRTKSLLFSSRFLPLIFLLCHVTWAGRFYEIHEHAVAEQYTQCNKKASCPVLFTSWRGMNAISWVKAKAMSMMGCAMLLQHFILALTFSRT